MLEQTQMNTDSGQGDPIRGCRFRYSLGSLLLATTCAAIVIASFHYFPRSGIFVSMFCFYLALPLLFVAFVHVSLNEHDDVASKQVFAFFATMFAIAFIACGTTGDVGTFAACLGPIFLWPPQLFAIMFFRGRALDKRRTQELL